MNSSIFGWFSYGFPMNPRHEHPKFVSPVSQPRSAGPPRLAVVLRQLQGLVEALGAAQELHHDAPEPRPMWDVPGGF